jgi:hypothetical protein
MKKTLLFILLLGITLLCAQAPLSQRNRALAGAIDGDWEKIYDPIELSLMPGTYFFTNLAEFNQDFIMPDNDDEIDWDVEGKEFLRELPLGVSFKNPFFNGMSHSMLLRARFQGQKPGSESWSTDLEDTDGDDVINHKTMTHRKVDDLDTDGRLAWIFNTSWKSEFQTFGLMFSYDDNHWRSNKASDNIGGAWDYGLEGFYGGCPSQDVSFDSSYLFGSDNYSKSSESGDFLHQKHYRTFNTLFSVMTPVSLHGNVMEWRVDAGLDLTLDSGEKYTDKYTGAYEYLMDFGGVQTGGLSMTAGNHKEDETRVNAARLGTSLKRVFAPAAERTEDGFYEFTGSVAYLYGDQTKSLTSSLYSQTYDESEIDTVATKSSTSSSSVFDGDLKGLQGACGARVNLTLGEFVHFGMGGAVSVGRTTSDGDYRSSYLAYDQQLYGEAFDDDSDFMIEESYEEIVERQYISEWTKLRVPVGLEFRLPKADLSDHDSFLLRNFALRIGVLWSYDRLSKETRDKLLKREPRAQIITTGDGDVTEAHEFDPYFESSRTTEVTYDSSKRFSFGLGYRHSDHLNIDWASYIDGESTFFTGVSFTVHL